MTFSRTHIATLSAALKETQARLWTKNEHGIYTIDLEDTEIIDPKDAIPEHDIRTELKNAGIGNFQVLASSSGLTEVFSCVKEDNGQQFVVRKSDEDFNHKRSRMPMVTPFFKRWYPIEDYSVELLPLMPISYMHSTDVPDRQKENYKLPFRPVSQIFRAAIGTYAMARNGTTYDMGLPPLGLPWSVDPGNVNFLNPDADNAQALSKVIKNIKGMDLPSDVSWLDKDDNCYTETLFPNPFD